MLLRRGWGLVVGAVAFVAVGRVLGIVEMYAFAVASLALPVGAVMYVRGARFRLQAARTLKPPRVHAGAAARVELAVRNQADRNSPILAARDPFDHGRRWAQFLLAPLAPGETARAAYRLPTEERGLFALGPLELVLTDPFGLAQATFEAAPETTLTVYPRIDAIAPLPHTAGHDPNSGAAARNHLGLQGEEFYALRPYVQGDDLRRVHWPSTARLDELQIRQDEVPWQGRATVVADLRRHIHSPVSLEVALSATASILVATASRRSLVRLVTTAGVDSGFGSGHAHIEAILEHLAAAELESRGHLPSVLARLRKDGNGGSLALVTTAQASQADLAAATRMKGRFGQITTVLLEASVIDPAVAQGLGAGRQGADTRSGPAAGKVVRVSAQRSFAQAWTEQFPYAGGPYASAPVGASRGPLTR